MRKLLSFLLSVVLLAAGIVTVNATEGGIRVHDVTMQGENTVYVPVSLQTTVTGTAIGLSYTYDNAVLEILPAECRWIPSGMLSDFSRTGPQAVWAANGAKALSGDLCVLAFRILNEKTFRETEVSCSVTIKNGADTAGAYEDSAKILKVCDHQFGDWSEADTFIHSRTCSLCGQEEQQSHDWDAGTILEPPEKQNVTVITYRCKICAAERVKETFGGNQEILPTYPESTSSSEPLDYLPEETRPEPSYPSEKENQPNHQPKPTKPSSVDTDKPVSNAGNLQQNQNGNVHNRIPQPKDYNQKEESNLQNQQKDGEKQFVSRAESGMLKDNALETIDTPDYLEVTHPMAIPVDETTEPQPEHADGVGPAEKAGTSLGTWFVLGTILAVSAVGVLVVKKRKR